MYHIPVYKIQIVRDSTQRMPVKHMGGGPVSAADLLSFYLKGKDREHFIAVMLDVRERVIGVNTVSVGTLTSTIVHPREVFKAAILSNAHAIIVGHNHPSGEVAPSKEDILITYDLVNTGKLLRIPVLDHIIVGEDGRFSSLLALGYIAADNGGLYTQTAMTPRVIGCAEEPATP